jgi:hypothetical protein
LEPGTILKKKKKIKLKIKKNGEKVTTAETNKD